MKPVHGIFPLAFEVLFRQRTGLRFQDIELLPFVHGYFCSNNVSQSNKKKKGGGEVLKSIL